MKQKKSGAGSSRRRAWTQREKKRKQCENEDEDSIAHAAQKKKSASSRGESREAECKFTSMFANSRPGELSTRTRMEEGGYIELEKKPEHSAFSSRKLRGRQLFWIEKKEEKRGHGNKIMSNLIYLKKSLKGADAA